MEEIELGARSAAVRGSTARGQRRRDALIEAAARLLESGGFAAVSHRAVAAKARLPLAATTYYFASLDDLILAAVRRLGEPQLAGARALAAELPAHTLPDADVARTVVSIVIGSDGPVSSDRLLTFYERMIQAGRQARLRPVVQGWTAELVDLVDGVLRRQGYRYDQSLPRTLVALVDGLLLNLLVEGAEDVRSAAAVNVEQVLRVIDRSRPTSSGAC